MPSTSLKQKKLFGIARGVQKGEVSPSYSKAATKIAKTVSTKKVREFAKTKLPKSSFIHKRSKK